MPTSCVLLDFDGTFTDVETEAQSFLPVFRQELESHVGRSLAPEWEGAERTIAENPDRYGWESAGVIVAPATADPYIRATTIASLVLNQVAPASDGNGRAALVQEIYRRSYTATSMAFREEAADVLRLLVNTVPVVCFVSNARPDVMRAKLEQLAPDLVGRLRIFGDARKQMLVEPASASPRFSALPVSTNWFGPRGRPIYLRRGHYFDVLERIWTETGCRPADTLVGGDVFELDLAMPAALGCRVHLICRPDTGETEVRALRRLRRRAEASNTLWGLAAHVLRIPRRVRARDGCTIRLPPRSREHLVAHPESAAHLKAAVATLDCRHVGQYLEAEVDLHRVVGAVGCVTTPRVAPDETTDFATRPNRRAPSRVVLRDNPGTTTVFCVQAKRCSATQFELLTAYAGRLAPPEPWDENGLRESNITQHLALDYWCEHALVWQPSWPVPFRSTWEKVLRKES